MADHGIRVPRTGRSTTYENNHSSPRCRSGNRPPKQAQEEDVLVRAPDGTEFMLTAVDDFDHEIAQTRRNRKLMALLDERGKQKTTISLDEVKRQLGLSS
jgi:hypothetical protein